MILRGIVAGVFLLVILVLALRLAWATGRLLLDSTDQFWGTVDRRTMEQRSTWDYQAFLGMIGVIFWMLAFVFLRMLYDLARYALTLF